MTRFDRYFEESALNVPLPAPYGVGEGLWARRSGDGSGILIPDSLHKGRFIVEMQGHQGRIIRGFMRLEAQRIQGLASTKLTQRNSIAQYTYERLLVSVEFSDGFPDAPDFVVMSKQRFRARFNATPGVQPKAQATVDAVCVGNIVSSLENIEWLELNGHRIPGHPLSADTEDGEYYPGIRYELGHLRIPLVTAVELLGEDVIPAEAITSGSGGVKTVYLHVDPRWWQSSRRLYTEQKHRLEKLARQLNE